MREKPQSAELLGWYDRHARVLPWRVPPGSNLQPNPYQVWLSEVMLQQTTVAAVKSYFDRFTQLWPSVTDLADAEDQVVMGEWAGLGYYARARNLLKCARVIRDDHDGVFPDTREALLGLPGIGPYTASAIAAIAFDRSETVVDGNVERVMARLFNVGTPLPTAKSKLTEYAASLTPNSRPGDYAQAVMDLGATICTPRNPACGICPWNADCMARSAGTQADLPKKTPRKPKPIRHGIAYLGRRSDGAWLLEERPKSGLLGGMLGWPGTEWAESTPTEWPPCKADWHTPDAEVRHTFTHFHLRLTLRFADLPMTTQPDRGRFIDANAFRPSNLPTVMRKAFDLAGDSVALDRE